MCADRLLCVHHSVLRKIDDCYKSNEQCKKAYTELQEEKCEHLPSGFKIFGDLEKRATKYKAQKEENDIGKLEDLTRSAKSEKTFLEGKVAELGKRKKDLSDELDHLRQQLKDKSAAAAAAAASNDDDDDDITNMALLMVEKRSLRDKISQKEAELGTLKEALAQYQTDEKELAKRITEYEGKIGGQPAGKKQKTKKT